MFWTSNNNKQAAMDPTSAVFNDASIPRLSEESSDCFGIDFGNSNICVSYYQNQQFRVVQLENKTSTMPAVITFQENDFYIGNAAKTYQTKKATKSTFFDFRRIISSGKVEFAEMPFCISNDLVFEPATFPVPLIRGIAILLQWIKNKVEADLQLIMRKIVLTVPTGFNQYQRQIMVNAAKIVNLEVMHILHEPTAAAITYFVANPKEKKTLCVLDFGSSKLNAAIICIGENGIELLECQNDSCLGGRDFDECIFKHICEKIAKDYPNSKLQQKHFTTLREKCIAAKVNLSTGPETNIEIEVGNEEISYPIERREFEILCKDLFKRVETLLNEMLQSSKNYKISDVLMIGGSTRIPKIQQIVQQTFPTAYLNKTLNADEAVARGAATYATFLAGLIVKNKLTVIDLLPWNQQPVCNGTKMEYIVDKNGKIQKRVYEFAEDIEIDFNQEKREVEKLFEKKKSLAPPPPKEPEIVVKNNLPNVEDAENLLKKAKSQEFQYYARQINVLLENAGIHYHLSMVNEGRDHVEKLGSRVPRINIFLQSLELLQKCNNKGYKNETNDLQKLSSSLYNICLDLTDAELQSYFMHFENYNYWLELEDKIVEFERKRQTRATQNIISDIKRAKDDIKKSLKQFGKSNKPVALFDQERINQLIQRFQSELTSPNQTYYG